MLNIQKMASEPPSDSLSTSDFENVLWQIHEKGHDDEGREELAESFEPDKIWDFFNDLPNDVFPTSTIAWTVDEDAPDAPVTRVFITVQIQDLWDFNWPPTGRIEGLAGIKIHVDGARYWVGDRIGIRSPISDARDTFHFKDGKFKVENSRLRQAYLDFLNLTIKINYTYVWLDGV